jgi:Trk K+ transport system NAD-binding subunit
MLRINPTGEPNLLEEMQIKDFDIVVAPTGAAPLFGNT